MSTTKTIKEDIENTYPEVDNLKQDAQSMKNNTVELARHVKEDASEQAKVISKKAQERYMELKEIAGEEYQKIEKKVKEKPTQSIAIAFAAGLALSLLLGRR